MITINCRKCNSSKIKKNGRTKTGQQKYYCHNCRFYGILETKQAEKQKQYKLVGQLHLERISQRGISRITGVDRKTIRKLLKKKPLPELKDTITPSIERPILEMDELWSYVGNKKNKVWIWLALERATRKIVGFALGDRSENTCKALWKSLPADYRKRAVIYTDHWDSYKSVLPSKRHRAVDKNSGETNHIERFNNTLRQMCSNLVRKTLSFSKKLLFHEARIKSFILHYNKMKAV